MKSPADEIPPRSDSGEHTVEEIKKRMRKVRRRRADLHAADSPGPLTRPSPVVPYHPPSDDPVGDLHHKVDILTALVLSNAALNNEFAASEPTIWAHGNRSYSSDGKRPVQVTNEEDQVLTAFAEESVAMSSSDLELRSGVTNASRVITQLCDRYNKMFSSAITRPNGKGKGGYFIRVLPIGG